MTYVIDCSYLCALFLPDEHNEQTDDFFSNLTQKDVLYAPSILLFEITNVLVTAVKNGRINNETANEIVRAIEDLHISYEHVSQFVCLHYSLKHNLSAYDAAYYALSIEKNCPLLTFDKQLLSVC